jgi:hypothetical protein
MSITIISVHPDDECRTEDDEEPAHRRPHRRKYMVCPVCDGEGTTVNPSIDCNGLTAEDFDDDPDFEESYWRGDYDVVCGACKGERVVTDDRMGELERNAADRRLAAMEDGNFAAWAGAGDYRWG